MATPNRFWGDALSVGPRSLTEEETAALIFDVDGTLIDTMAGFYPSWVDVCEPRGLLPFSLDDFYGFAGVPVPDIAIALYRRKHGAAPSAEWLDAFVRPPPPRLPPAPPQHPPQLVDKKAAHKAREATAGMPKAIECVVAIAREAAARGVPVAVATSGVRCVLRAARWQLRAHRRQGRRHRAPGARGARGAPLPLPLLRRRRADARRLQDLFSVSKGNFVVAADVPRGKPHPDIYLEAARRLGVPPERCIAYEDGEAGLQSAHAAGMQVLDVTAMAEYPASASLRAAKARQQEARTWL